MKASSLEKMYVSALKNSGLPDSVIDVISFYVAKNKSSGIGEINSPMKTLISLNDICIIYHSDFHGAGEAIEINNPYCETEFSVVSTVVFKKIVNNLLSGNKIDVVEVITKDPAMRTDIAY